ncbi:MAG TPA: LysE family translocator [Stellaceae bacterium]|nr:LysE family translocator [Stellaceae bacterium]
MSATPGPNNLMVMASAATFGYRRTIPHMLGISAGFPLMLLAVGCGLASVFEAYPLLHHVLKIVGAAYLLFLAWKIATAVDERDKAKPVTEEEAVAQRSPLSFSQAALFQWVNVKAWVVAIGAVTTYTTIGGDILLQATVIALTFAVVSFPSNSLWAGFGLAMGRLLHSARSRRVFNVTMAGLLVASLVPLLD